MSDLDKTLDDLAKNIGREAMAFDTPLAEKIDALRVLVALDAQRFKQKKNMPDDDPDEPSMDTLRDEINGAQNGRGASRIRGN